MADLNYLKSTELEKTLGKTIYSRCKKVMDNYIMENLKQGSFSIPIVQALVGTSKTLEKNLIELYDRKILVDTSHISDEIKVLQASAFDGLLIGVNLEKGGTTGIYTANPNAIFNFDNESKFSIDKTLELNENGIINAVRIDVEYLNSEEKFSFKPVSLNKNTNLQVADIDTMEGRFLLIPYIAFQRSLAFFKEMLDDGRTLKVTMEQGGMLKERYISAKSSELAKYCDSKEFAESLKPEYFPLKGFFYAPVLGASSLTLGRTRVDLIDICKVESTTKPKVSKAENPVDEMLRDSVAEMILTDIEKYDTDTYADIVSKMPKKDKVFGAMQDAPSVVSIMRYMRQLSPSDKEKALKLIPGFDDAVSEYKGVLNKCEYLDASKYKPEEIKELLKSGVYKFIIRKNDCMYSSMTITNDENILRSIYGKDYFKRYESLGVRLYKLESMVEHNSVEDSLAYCGFETDSDTISNVISVLGTNDPQKSTHERLADVLGDSGSTRKQVRKSTSNDSLVLARTCFAIEGADKSSDYYKYIDISKVVSMCRLA